MFYDIRKNKKIIKTELKLIFHLFSFSIWTEDVSKFALADNTKGHLVFLQILKISQTSRNPNFVSVNKIIMFIDFDCIRYAPQSSADILGPLNLTKIF